jgi:hypothetical protein
MIFPNKGSAWLTFAVHLWPTASLSLTFRSMPGRRAKRQVRPHNALEFKTRTEAAETYLRIRQNHITLDQNMG